MLRRVTMTLEYSMKEMEFIKHTMRRKRRGTRINGDEFICIQKYMDP